MRQAPAEHYGWLLSRVGCASTPDFRALEAVDERTGRILGMVGYDLWTPKAVHMHCAGSPAALRALVKENGCPAFRYPFELQGRQVVLVAIHVGNRKSSRLVAHLGFRLEAAIPAAEVSIWSMRREDCRWLHVARRAA